MTTPPTQAEIADDFGDEPWRALLAPLGGGVVLSDALLEAVRLVPSIPNARAFSVLDFLEFIWPHVDKSILSVTPAPVTPKAEEMAGSGELLFIKPGEDPEAYRAAVRREHAHHEELLSLECEIEALRADCARLEECLNWISENDWQWKGGGSPIKLPGQWAIRARAALAARQDGG